MLANTAAFPLPAYPGRAAEAEGLLQRLLRKKLEVGAEGWVEEGRGRGREVVEGGVGMGGGVGSGVVGGGDMGGGDRSGEGSGGEGKEDEGEGDLLGEGGLWVWAGMEANRVARGYKWGGVGEEEEEEDGEDEDMDEDMEGEGGDGEKDGGATTGGEGGGEMLPMGDVLRFLSTGREAVGKVDG